MHKPEERGRWLKLGSREGLTRAGAMGCGGRRDPTRVTRVRGHPAVTQYMRNVHVGNQDPIWLRSPGRPLPGPAIPLRKTV